MTGGMNGGAGAYGGGGGAGAGAGGYSGGGEMGASGFQALPEVPPTSFRSSAVSGTEATFVPSTFLPYKQAIAAGQAVLDAQHRTVAEAAAENMRAHRLRAKAAIIENATGAPVITTP